MKIALQHRNRIWRALVEYRNSMPTASVVDSQHHQFATAQRVIHDSPGGARDEDGLSYSLGGERTRLTAAAASMAPGTAIVDGNGRVYDVMRFTYRHKVPMKEEDHNYC